MILLLAALKDMKVLLKNCFAALPHWHRVKGTRLTQTRILGGHFDTNIFESDMMRWADMLPEPDFQKSQITHDII